MLDFSLSNTKNDIIIKDNLSYVIQQIELLFDTDVYDVLGDTSYGSNYDKYLYTLGMSNYALESKILSDIKKLDLKEYKVSVSVNIVEGTIRDIAFIDINISDDYEVYTKTYVIK